MREVNRIRLEYLMVNCNQMKTQLDEKGQMLITQDSIIYIHRAILNKVPLAGLSSV